MRLSGPEDTPTYEDSNDEGSPSRPERAARRDAPDNFTMTQHDIDRDGGFAHLQNQDRDDQRAAARLKARKQVLGENRAADNAIIRSITLINFMCHDNLHVELGPLINFIFGPNGAGKSAVLTGLTLCLGAKASTTNRGGSLKSFIKTGRDHANLITKIKNEGEDAYKPDLFGETIIIERNFSRAGTSGFKLKNSSGRLISSKRADVEDVIEYFAMQIDNPMNILSQDQARSFLNASSASTKYKNFVKGVQLEQLDNDYRLVGETADQMKNKLIGSEEGLKFLQKKAERAAERARIVDQHESMRAQYRYLMKQSAWAQVEDVERELRNREQVVAERQEEIESAQQVIQEKDHTYQQTNEAAERVEAAKAKAELDLDPLKEEKAVAQEAFDATTREVASAFEESRRIRDELQTAKQEEVKLREDIAGERLRIEDTNGGAHIKKKAELSRAEELVQITRAKLDDCDANKPRLQERLRAAEAEHKKSQGPLEAKKSEIKICENRIESLGRDAGHGMAGYDRNIPRLLNIIRDDNGFREKPIGPIGLHIKLLDQKWSNILEKQMGNLLNGFIVTSKPDQVRLAGMLRQLRLDFCPVVIGNHHSIDTRGHEPDEQYETVLRVLEIDNDLVKKQLIINQGIEQTVLIESQDDAYRVLYEGARPRNINQVYCLHHTMRGHGIRLTYMSGSSDPSTSPIDPPRGPPRMKTDIEAQVSYQKESLQSLKADYARLEARCRDIWRAVEGGRNALNQQNRDRRNIEIELQKAEDLVDRIKEDLDKFNGEKGKLDALESELGPLQEKVEIHSQSFKEATMAKDRQNIMASSANEALKAIKARIAEQEAVINKVNTKLQRLKSARQIALQEKNIAIEAVERLEAAKTHAEEKRDRAAVRVAEFIELAMSVANPRVAVKPGETGASIDAKLVKLKDSIETYNKKLGATDEQVKDEAEKTKRAYEAFKEQTDQLMKLQESLKQSYRQRILMWRKFQRHITSQSRLNFSYYLSERGFRGKLLIDHDNKLLEIEVEPDETKKSEKGRATTTLSGGEKSFSGICLLMSLWEAISAPMRGLDEFDVFMDQVNRDVSTTLIVCLPSP
jgi:chromosome segregation ATPase